ncbi:MAG: PilZ domain-containing protein [Thermodesulfovibrionales bacterium]|jgi:CheY-like chemotaxis protein
MKKVIIAEDLKTIIDKEKSFFNRSDMRIFTAATNERVLALHKAEKANLIIAKIDAPDMSGEKLCSLVREDEELRSVSLIVVSPETEAAHERCLQCRANAFVASPIINGAILLEEAHQLLHVAPRTAGRIPISVKLNGTSKKTVLIGSSEDISTSGMLFEAAAGFFEGDTIKCSFALPGSTPINVQAEIVRVVTKESQYDTNLYGIKFLDLDAAALSAIEAFVKRES